MQQHYLKKKEKKLKEFNFEKLQATMCGVKYGIEFKFENETLRKLGEIVTFVSVTDSNEKLSLSQGKRSQIILGNHCCNDIDLSIKILYVIHVILTALFFLCFRFFVVLFVWYLYVSLS